MCKSLSIRYICIEIFFLDNLSGKMQRALLSDNE